MLRSMSYEPIRINFQSCNETGRNNQVQVIVTSNMTYKVCCREITVLDLTCTNMCKWQVALLDHHISSQEMEGNKVLEGT